MVVQTNILALNADRMYGSNVKTNSKSTEKLSSGYKINRAADDAAGLTISEKMRHQIRGLTQASSNCQDGVSFAQTADGALGEVHSMLHRAKELSVKAANGTLTEADRNAIEAEITEITNEIDRVKESTQFNTLEIFPEAGHDPGELLSSNIASKSITENGVEITWKFVTSDGTHITEVSSVNPTGSLNDNANSDLANLTQRAASKAISMLKANMPVTFNDVATKGVTIGLNLANIDGKSNTLASVAASYSWGTLGSNMTYTLNVDTSDYKLNGPYTAAEESALASTIAHEMVHALMDDVNTVGMFGISPESSRYPGWFIEGTAQTASGDNGWVTLNASSDDAAIKSYLSGLGDSNNGKYGVGYLAVMDLGYEIAKENGYASLNYDGKSIIWGIDHLLSYLSNGNGSGGPKTLDEAINTLTSGKYTSASDFASKLKSGDADIVNNVKEILSATGSGAGSVLAGSLSDATTTAFTVPSSIIALDYFKIDPSVTKVGNVYTGTSDFPTPTPPVSGDDLIIQAGAKNSEADQIKIKRFNISSTSLFGPDKIHMTDIDSARDSMAKIDTALEKVSAIRSYYGAIQNRLEHTISNLDNVVENTTAAESQIRDTDMAKEMLNFTSSQILIQSSSAMLSSANQNAQNVLSLLQ